MHHKTSLDIQKQYKGQENQIIKRYKYKQSLDIAYFQPKFDHNNSDRRLTENHRFFTIFLPFYWSETSFKHLTIVLDSFWHDFPFKRGILKPFSQHFYISVVVFHVLDVLFCHVIVDWDLVTRASFFYFLLKTIYQQSNSWLILTDN